MLKEAKFYLHEPGASKPTYVFLKFKCNDKPLKYPTGLKVMPQDWDPGTQRSGTDRKINSVLNRIYEAVEQYQESCRILGKQTNREELRGELNGITNKVYIKTSSGFFDYVNIIINEARLGKLLTPARREYAEGSIKNFEKSRNVLMEFNPKLTFDNITIETYLKFIQFCHLKGYGANYTGKIIKDWKTFMNIGIGRKWHKNYIYKDPEFKKTSEQTYQVYLDSTEIKLLTTVPLTGLQEIIRDRFIINLFTGLRISDMKTLTTENIQDDCIIHINKKTGKKVVIPMHSEIKRIIKKYKGVMPRQYNDVAVNREIKNIACLAGITSAVRFTKTVGGRKVEFIKKKYQLITNHTCRRSLATNLLKHVDIQQAMPVLGMSLKTLDHYNKITPEQNAEVIKGNKFFKS